MPAQQATPCFDLPEVVITASRIYSAEVLIAAKCVCGEAEGEPFFGQALVANVILNRMENRGKTLLQVIKAKGQFDGAERIKVPTKRCLDATFQVFVKGFRPLSREVEYFLNPKTSTDKKWKSKLAPFLVLEVKNHSFYERPSNRGKTQV